MQIKQLTNVATNQMKDMLLQHKKEERTNWPSLCIQDFEIEDVNIDTSIEVDERKQFNNKFELAQYLYEQLHQIPMISDGIWHFFMIVYQEQLFKDKQIKAVENYIVSESVRYPFTHLLKPTYDLYRFYSKTPETVEFLLLNPIHESGGLFLEIVKRQDIMRNRHFIEIIKEFFYDSRNKKLETGHIDYTLRLIALFKQYARTYDLYSMPKDMILDQLIKKHKEFERFAPHLYE